jgi:ectoine hydroxylase-related dioxygenase (phytanoyl-CoA dioxygenase family)
MPSLVPLTSRVEARAPRLAAAARRSAWKARNASRTRGFRPAESLVDGALLQELRERGIAVRPFDEVFRDHARLEELEGIAGRREAQREGAASKDFLERLMPPRVEAGGPFVALALEPQVVALANAYIGMHSYLRGLEMWRNVPTDDPPKLSQLWHRDWDDVVNLKIFVYLSDVTEESGPFVFAPGTQPGGPRQLDVKDRLSDEEMAQRIPREDWVVCTGPPGTVVFADTCGYHKGGKPTRGDRLLWTAQFTSGAAQAKRNFELMGGAPDGLTPEQRWALFENPRHAA